MWAWRARYFGRERRTTRRSSAQVRFDLNLATRQLGHSPAECRVRAELVAAILKEGGLLDANSNPGSATPETLYRLYKDRAAVTANPFLLRNIQAETALSFGGVIGESSDQILEREALLKQRVMMQPIPTAIAASHNHMNERRRADSPVRGRFKVVSQRAAPLPRTPNTGRAPQFQITLNSLDMKRTMQSH